MPLYWVLFLSEFVCESFKSSISIPYRPMVLLDITPVWLNQTSQEFISSADSKIWSAWCEAHSPHHSREIPHFWDPFWSWIIMQGRVFLAGPCLCLPHLPQYDPFILHWGVAIQLLLRFFSMQIVPYIDVYFLWLWEEVSSGLYFATIFNCSSHRVSFSAVTDSIKSVMPNSSDNVIFKTKKKRQ